MNPGSEGQPLTSPPDSRCLLSDIRWKNVIVEKWNIGDEKRNMKLELLFSRTITKKFYKFL